MLKDLSPERAKLVRASIAKFYAADDGNADDGNTNNEAYSKEALKQEFLTEYKGLRGRFSNLFQRNTNKNNDSSSPSETTNLV